MDLLVVPEMRPDIYNKRLGQDFCVMYVAFIEGALSSEKRGIDNQPIEMTTMLYKEDSLGSGGDLKTARHTTFTKVGTTAHVKV
ncbi:hypothetical protein CTI12_AA448230 [Artemisia annua]|uniref:Uncharacterized protein n=1 Tax=Artemisia annua TaxID=35608 RepID=A0A2U1LVS9_ARTAN|nr:hypothetical protein CTI12_AA448230 [Artemisia annua]